MTTSKTSRDHSNNNDNNDNNNINKNESSSPNKKDDIVADDDDCSELTTDNNINDDNEEQSSKSFPEKVSNDTERHCIYNIVRLSRCCRQSTCRVAVFICFFVVRCLLYSFSSVSTES